MAVLNEFHGIDKSIFLNLMDMGDLFKMTFTTAPSEVIRIEKLKMKKFIDYHSDLNCVGLQIARDGTLLIIETHENEEEILRPLAKRDWTIRMIRKNGIDSVVLKDVTIIPSMVDIFTDGTLLIVQSRCPYRNGNPVKNAKIYNVNSELLDEFTLGDGINHIQIDENDTIWVGYFDEGVYGNYGWHEPIGSDGVIAFSKKGEKLWRARDYHIDDCYALNVVSSKEVYFYYYADFKLVKLTDMKEEICYQVEGDDTLEQFVFDEAGLIGEIDLYTMMRFQIEGQSVVPKEELQLTDEQGNPLPNPGLRLFRGNLIYAFGEDGIYMKEL